MIVYTKQGNRVDIFDLTAVYGGVWVTPFNNTKTVVDSFDSSVWTWESMDNYTEEILGVTQNGATLFPVLSFADCLALAGTFYFDNTNGLLYVRYYDTKNDRDVNRFLSSLAYITAGYSSEYNQITKNVFDGFYYQTKITALAGFSKKADPIRLGLIAFDTSSYTITDQANELYKQSSSEIVGVPLWAYAIEDDGEELANENRIFTAYQTGAKHGRESMTYNLIETRLFENKPVCPNVLSVTDFPNAGDNAGKIIPVAFGDIRRGIMLLTNIDSLTSASGTAIFLVADPSLYEVLAIDHVYDATGVEMTITSMDLVNCIVEVTKPADVSPTELNKWSWQGKGYDIDGDYNNGLDIIRACFLSLANIPYLISTYNVATWESETAANTDPVGGSVQSDKGFIEEVAEPISVSLQGVFEILGDGRLSAAFRNINAPVSLTITKAMQLDEPPIDPADSKNTVSELLVEYSRDFTTKEALTYLSDDTKSETIDNYGINRREPLSPVKTWLTTAAGAKNCADKIMATAKEPERIINVQKRQVVNDLKLFEIIKIDTGAEDVVNWEYGELLAFTPDFFNNSMNLTIRVLPDYDEDLVGGTWFGTVFSDGSEEITTNFSDGSEDITENFQTTGGDVI